MMNAGLFGVVLLAALTFAGCAPRADREPSALRDRTVALIHAPLPEDAPLPVRPAPTGMLEPPAEAEPGALRSYTEEEDFDGDGIADTRTTRRFEYDAYGRACRLVVEEDFDADGTIDARTTRVSSYGPAPACGT